MKTKKLISIIAAVVMLAAISSTAFAAEPVMPDKDGNVSIGKEEVTIGVEGLVEPITLAATCNIGTYLSIDPNQPEGKQFVSPVIAVTNDCNAPITLYAVGMKATGNAPKVVDNDKYNERGWSQLNRTQTYANIALGLLDAGRGGSNMWFAEESEQQPIALCNIAYQGQQTMTLQAKFGRAWSGGESFKYGMTVKISLQQ